MSQAAVNTAQASAKPQGAEQRGEKRYSLIVAGRFYSPEGAETWCVTDNDSLSGYELRCSKRLRVGTSFDLELQHLGTTRVQVVRHTDLGFAVRILSTVSPYEVFVRTMIWLVRSQAGEVKEVRTHERIVPIRKDVRVRLPDGTMLPGEIIDVSRSGCALSLPVKPPVGTVLHVGRTAAKVVRHLPLGIGVTFNAALPASRDLSKSPDL